MADSFLPCSHWQYSQMAAKFLVMLIRHDRPFPVSGVKLLVNSLNHEYLSMRKVSTLFMITTDLLAGLEGHRSL